MQNASKLFATFDPHVKNSTLKNSTSHLSPAQRFSRWLGRVDIQNCRMDQPDNIVCFDACSGSQCDRMGHAPVGDLPLPSAPAFASLRCGFNPAAIA